MFSVNPIVSHVVKLEKITLVISTLWESDEGFLFKKEFFIALKSNHHMFYLKVSISLPQATQRTP